MHTMFDENAERFSEDQKVLALIAGELAFVVLTTPMVGFLLSVLSAAAVTWLVVKVTRKDDHV